MVKYLKLNLKEQKMKLDFNKTYNNVSFKGWSKRCVDSSDKEAFIKEIKHNNPKIIIVSSSMDAIADGSGFLVEVIGMFADINDNFNYEFIDEFFEKEYFKVCKLLGDKSLTYWEDIHYENNSMYLDEIEESYNHLKTEEDERDLYFENLVDAFDSLHTFDVSSSEVDGLSSRSIDNLIEYNNIIETFKNKFNEIKDEMCDRLEIYKED